MRQHANDNCEVPFCRECLAGIKRGIGMASEMLDGAREMRSNPNQVSDLGKLGKRLVKRYGLEPDVAEQIEQEAANVYAHKTADGFCCACDADIALSLATRQSLLAEIAERGPQLSYAVNMYEEGFNDACVKWHKLLTELAEEGDKSKQEPSV